MSKFANRLDWFWMMVLSIYAAPVAFVVAAVWGAW